MAWANMVCVIVYCPLAFFVFIVMRPQAERMATLCDKAAIRFGSIRDATRLHDNLIGQLNGDRSVWLTLFSLWGALAFLLVGAAFLGVINAFYLIKAYRLMKAQSKG